jgi:hypothetical protein
MIKHAQSFDAGGTAICTSCRVSWPCPQIRSLVDNGLSIDQAIKSLEKWSAGFDEAQPVVETRTVSSTGGEKGVKAARFDLIPIGPLTELAEHYGKGALKYANHQWRRGYEWGKSYAALQRHLTAFWAGEDYDRCPFDGKGCAFETAEGEPFTATEPGTCYNHTGSHHMAAVAWHAFALLEFKGRFRQHDDRYRPADEPDPVFYES